VLEAPEKIAEEVQLPGGYRLEWAGDFANFQNAIDRLSVAVPIAIALILLLCTSASAPCAARCWPEARSRWP
jgi:cobalt-zinc-cadmium resistance protein CzcA